MSGGGFDRLSGAGEPQGLVVAAGAGAATSVGGGSTPGAGEGSGGGGGAAPGPPPGIRTVPGTPSLPVTRLVLVRHGEAECNVSGVCGGMIGCTGLTDRGRGQVGRLRRRLGVTGELAGTSALYASVLPRAIETARIIAPALAPAGPDGTVGAAPEVRTDCGLCELHPGEADGLTWGQFSERFPAPDWDTDPGRPIAPGGESWTGFVQRVAGTLEAIVARHPGELVVAACHAGVVEASLLAMVPVAGGREGARLQLRTQHASLTTWEVDGGRWRLLGYNDAGHLVWPAWGPEAAGRAAGASDAVVHADGTARVDGTARADDAEAETVTPG